jgi:hypothetical protein
MTLPNIYLLKLMLSLCLINQAPRQEHIWGSGSVAPQFLNSALDRGEWSPSRPGHFISGEESPTLPIGYKDGCDPEPAWTLRRKEPPGISLIG